jgi:hypothetical protein
VRRRSSVLTTMWSKHVHLLPDIPTPRLLVLPILVLFTHECHTESFHPALHAMISEICHEQHTRHLSRALSGALSGALVQSICCAADQIMQLQVFPQRRQLARALGVYRWAGTAKNMDGRIGTRSQSDSMLPPHSLGPRIAARPPCKRVLTHSQELGF